MKPALRFSLALLTALAPVTAAAQDGDFNPTDFTVERFESLPAQGINVLNIATSEVLPDQAPSAGLFLWYVNSPLQLVDPDDEDDRIDLISGQFTGELSAAIGLFDIVDLGMVLPLVFYQDGEDLGLLGEPGRVIEGASAGDLRLIPKVQLADPDRFGGFGVSLLTSLYLPTGDSDSFNSDGGVRFEPRLAADWRHPVGLTVAGNLGYLFRPRNVARNYVADDVVRWGVGAELPTGVPKFQIVTSLFGDIQLEDNLSIDARRQPEDDGFGSPVEWLGGLQYRLPYDLVANVGAGGGLTEGVGAPSFRVFGSISYTPTAQDTDGDGIYDADDKCPKEAEDVDDFQDSDGCPDWDNDDDGVFDADDKCPMTAGDAENQGCPIEAPADTDGDGIVDDADKCPDEPEDVDTFEDEDGCPDPDNDGDRLLDVEDECPLEAGPQDYKGCPIPDRDGDGIPDDVDKCPDEPETMNGIEDEDGCPDEDKAKIKVTREKIEISETVYFDTGKATIKPVSYELLNQVAGALNANPQITKIRIEGHTDSQGSEAYNLELSKERAASVRQYLIGQGVVPQRLVSEGYGESKPIADNDTAAGREQNRRVEFLITEVNGEPTEGKSVTIEKTETVE